MYINQPCVAKTLIKFSFAEYITFLSASRNSDMPVFVTNHLEHIN